MCRVSVTCCCSRSGGGWLGWVAAGALVLLAGPVIGAALQATVELVTAVVIGLVAAAAVVVAGWVVKCVAEKVIDEWSLRRHNERMAQIHPHLRAELQQAHQPSIGVPVARPRVVGSPRQQAITPPAQVQIYPTPRTELRALAAQERPRSGGT